MRKYCVENLRFMTNLLKRWTSVGDENRSHDYRRLGDIFNTCKNVLQFRDSILVQRFSYEHDV